MSTQPLPSYIRILNQPVTNRPLNQELLIDLTWCEARDHGGRNKQDEFDNGCGTGQDGKPSQNTKPVAYAGRRTELSSGLSEAASAWCRRYCSPVNALRIATEIASTDACTSNVALPSGSDRLKAELRRITPTVHANPSVRVTLQTIEAFDGPNVLRTLRQTGCRMLVVKRSDGELVESVANAAPS